MSGCQTLTGLTRVQEPAIASWRAPSHETRKPGDYVGNVTLAMYSYHMKTIAITIPEELDAAAAAEAKRQGISKSELIRRGLATLLPNQDTQPAEDLWHELAGYASKEATAEPGEIDRVVYDS